MATARNDYASSKSSYDLARALRIYDKDGDLPARIAALWPLIEPALDRLNRAFANAYQAAGDARGGGEETAAYASYARVKFRGFDKPEWVASARTFVEQAY